MAISSIGGPAISADLMYQFYDNKAITPQIRAAVQKKQDESGSDSGTSNNSSTGTSGSKFGPAARVNITDQLIRMNIDRSTKESDKKETDSATAAKKPSRYDVLTEVKKSVAEREAAAKAEKDAQLKDIADKIAAAENPTTTPKDGE